MTSNDVIIKKIRRVITRVTQKKGEVIVQNYKY